MALLAYQVSTMSIKGKIILKSGNYHRSVLQTPASATLLRLLRALALASAFWISSEITIILNSLLSRARPVQLHSMRKVCRSFIQSGAAAKSLTYIHTFSFLCQVLRRCWMSQVDTCQSVFRIDQTLDEKRTPSSKTSFATVTKVRNIRRMLLISQLACDRRC